MPAPRAIAGLVLVKPQFEAGRKRVGKGGVVRDPAVHRDVLEQGGEWLHATGSDGVPGVCDSGHPGPKGNVEYFVFFCDAAAAPGPAPRSKSPRRGPGAVAVAHG